MSGAMNEWQFCVIHMTKCCHTGLYIIHPYMCEFENSFTDISGSNDPILLKLKEFKYFFI